MAEDPHVLRGGVFTQTYYTVTTLPAASAMQGERLWVTDLNQNPNTTFGVVVAGGGTYRGIVQSDGTNWRSATSQVMT